MIQLTKLNEPKVLADNKTAWTNEFDRNRSSRRYGHEEIKSILTEETSAKCAYCESKVNHISYDEVEHIKPKSIFPELVCEWNNLTIACQKCNRNKGSFYDADCAIINPYTQNPDEHLYWAGPMIFPLSKDVGKISRDKLQLNRVDLVIKRGEKLNRIHDLQQQAHESENASIKKALLNEIESLISENEEYSAASKAYILQAQPS